MDTIIMIPVKREMPEEFSDNGDGTYTVIFTNYSSGYTDILNDCYNLTSESIEGFGIKVNKGATGKAVVRPYNYNGKDTYQLISLNMQE